MGFSLKSITKGGNMGDFLQMGFTNPGQGIDNALGTDFFSYLTDPLDLWGYRAAGAKDEVSQIQLKAAQDAIQQQRDMLGQQNALLDPYRKAAEGNVPFMESIASGQSGSLTPQAQREWEQGSRQVNAALSARGLLNSGARRRMMSDTLANIGQRDIGRQWGRLVDVNQLGTGALNALGTAGRNAGQAAGSIYGNLGNALNQTAQNYGAQRQDTMNQAANSLYGLSDYLATKG